VIATTLTVRFAWWAFPAAYVIAFAYRPFVGTARALDVAEWTCLRALRIEMK
jgi:hypothetical protein